LFAAQDEAWPDRRRLQIELRATVVAVDGRFVGVVISYALLTVLLAVVARSPWWTAVLIGTASGFLALALHEVGHAVATHACGQSVRWIILSVPSSAVGTFAQGERYSPKTLALVAVAGPTTNLLCGLALLVGGLTTHGTVAVGLIAAALVNGVGFLNLWPGCATAPAGERKVPTDGALIMQAIQAARTGRSL